MIWPRLDRGHTTGLVNLQKGVLAAVIGVVTGHCIMCTHANRISVGYLANDFFKSLRDEEEEEKVHIQLGT